MSPDARRTRRAIGRFACIWNYAPITVGDDFFSAGGLTLNFATHSPLTLDPIAKPIRIGQRVWRGVNVTILAGVTIGDDVVIGADSVLTSNIPSNCIAIGVPSKKLRDLFRDEKTTVCSWAGTRGTP